MKSTEIHKNKLLKQIKKLENGKYEVGSRKVILRSDSKGRAFLPYLSYKNRINLIFRSGATIENPFMRKTLDQIRNTVNPVVILFFGTCEITVKLGKFLYLPDDIDARLEQIKQSYIRYKSQILDANNTAKVKFLDCPYQSMIIWNFVKGHTSPGSFSSDQKTLECAIKSLNVIIRDINGDQVVPRLSLDMVYSSKKRRKAPKYFRNYSLLRDGVHANHLLNKLWFLRIIRMITLA